ncbi:MAG: phosphotransferase family protein [Steroidobacteraceae bacterium]
MSGAAAGLARWFEQSLGMEDAVVERRLGGGNSNITELVTHSRGKVVLRRPPDAAISPSAATGVRREYRTLSALAGRARVPTAIAFCEDTAILGQPFLVAEFIEGVAISTELPASYPRNGDTLSRIGEELIDAIAAVHALDCRELGLEVPRGESAYVSRQIERWMRARATDAVRELPMFTETGRWLLAHCPTVAPTALIHGDFHLDNSLFQQDATRLAAIIDWELATIGDPLADLGLALAFWGPRPVEKIGFAFVQQVTRDVPGVVSRETLAQRWSNATGVPVGALDYYRVFALWRLAAIVEGAFVLYRKGLVADAYSRNLEHDVTNLLAEAAQIAGLGSAA